MFYVYRLHTLEKSRDSFPVCVVLVKDINTEDALLIGHSRLSVVIGQPKCCLVESGNS